MSLRVASVRELKTHLSRYLREVRQGDVVLVTDRGTVVAEVRTPTVARPDVSPGLQRLIDRGVVTPARRKNDSRLYPKSPVRVSAGEIDAALDWIRGE